MFPSLKARFGARLLDQMDAALEFSTLGSYGLADDRRPLALDLIEPVAVLDSTDGVPPPAGAAIERRGSARRTRDLCGEALSPPPRDRRGGPARP